MAQEGALRVPFLLLNCWLLANSGEKTVIGFSVVTMDEAPKLHQDPTAWSYRGSWLKSVGYRTKQKDMNVRKGPNKRSLAGTGGKEDKRER